MVTAMSDNTKLVIIGLVKLSLDFNGGRLGWGTAGHSTSEVLYSGQCLYVVVGGRDGLLWGWESEWPGLQLSNCQQIYRRCNSILDTIDIQ